MTADTLRRAATLMRERAGAARGEDSAERWTAIPSMDPDNDGWIVAHNPSDADYDTTVAQAIYDYEGYVSTHLAGWHPVVALAVADLIDHHVDRMESTGFVGHMHDDLIAVARAYLGDES